MVTYTYKPKLVLPTNESSSCFLFLCWYCQTRFYDGCWQVSALLFSISIPTLKRKLQDFKLRFPSDTRYFHFVLSVMSVSLKIHLHPRVLFSPVGWGSLRRIQDIKTSFLVRFLHASDILLDVSLQESKRRRSLRQNLKTNLTN